MTEHHAWIEWHRTAAEPAEAFSRLHRWRFDGGAEIEASPSPHVLAPPLSDPAAVDPEEALVAAASSCHMLFFLALAAKAGFTVDTYTDHAVGVMQKDGSAKMAITDIRLQPEIAFTGRRPSASELAELHHQSHERCFIANSLKTRIVVAPPEADSP